MQSIGQTELLTGAAVLVVLGVLLAIFLISRRSRTHRMQRQRERIREEFGQQYDRLAEERGSEEEAEKDLRQRRGRVGRQVQPLSDDSWRRYEEQWNEDEWVFVNPERSIGMADRTVSDLREERNFIADAPRMTGRPRKAWPPCTGRSPATTGRPAAPAPTSSPAPPEAPTTVTARTMNPRKTCCKSSASTAPSMSG